jgi:DNA polymerase-3 subunit delta
MAKTRTKGRQLFLLTGENNFALREELERWKRTFREKHGEVNLEIVQAKNLQIQDLLDRCQSSPFLSDIRLLLIEGIPRFTKEECTSLLRSLHPSTIVAFIEPSLDRRSSAAKFLLRHAEVRSFHPLIRPKLISWICRLCEEHGGHMEPGIAQHLIELVGTDQWHLKQECLKVLLYAAPEPPSQEDIHRVCQPSGTHAIWTLSDLIGQRKPVEALRYATALWESGEDAQSLWNIFLWVMRNIAEMWLWLHERNLPPLALARESGIPLPSIRSLLPYVQTLSEEQVRRILATAVEADLALKNGEIRATAEDSTELIALLERQILGLGIPSSPP